MREQGRHWPEWPGTLRTDHSLQCCVWRGRWEWRRGVGEREERKEEEREERKEEERGRNREVHNVQMRNERERERERSVTKPGVLLEGVAVFAGPLRPIVAVHSGEVRGAASTHHTSTPPAVVPTIELNRKQNLLWETFGRDRKLLQHLLKFVAGTNLTSNAQNILLS